MILEIGLMWFRYLFGMIPIVFGMTQSEGFLDFSKAGLDFFSP